MANVTGGPRERGQLIIITGLVIAVTLVTLALLLNTAIYTDNLASRGTAVGGDTAIGFQQTAEDSIRQLLELVNDQEHTSDDAVAGPVRDGITAFDEARTERYAEIGASVQLSNVSFNNGTRVRQTDSARMLTSAGGSADWTLSTNADNIRRFSLRFESLNDTQDPEEGAFVITISGSSSDWELYVYDNSSDLSLAVVNASEPNPVEVCDPADSFPLEVNITASTVNGNDCPDLIFTSSVNPVYDVSFTRGDDSTGTYNLTVNGSVNSPNFNDTIGESPYEFWVVYSVHFDVEYRTEELSYRSTVRVAPGEQS